MFCCAPRDSHLCRIICKCKAYLHCQFKFYNLHEGRGIVRRNVHEYSWRSMKFALRQILQVEFWVLAHRLASHTGANVAGLSAIFQYCLKHCWARECSVRQTWLESLWWLRYEQLPTSLTQGILWDVKVVEGHRWPFSTSRLYTTVKHGIDFSSHARPGTVNTRLSCIAWA